MNQESFDNLFAHLEEMTSSLAAFVSHYGLVEAMLYNSFCESAAYNDFIHYCFTKSTKHLKAAQLLLDNGFPEDAMVLSRSAYECYISIKSGIEDPDLAVDDLVQNKVALSTGRAEYVRTENGKINFRAIKYKGSEDLLKSPPSVEKLSVFLREEVSESLHRFMYNLLSEHAHVHMMGSGNYRDPDNVKYTIASQRQKNNAVVFCLFFGILILSQAIRFEDVEEEEYERCSCELSLAASDLSDHIKSLNIKPWLKQEFSTTLEHVVKIHT